jgi:hypothetical protein
MMTNSTEKSLRNTLGNYCCLLLSTHLDGGYYGMAVAKDVPTEWLKNSLFHNYFIPSLILFVVVGGYLLLLLLLYLNNIGLHINLLFC